MKLACVHALLGLALGIGTTRAQVDQQHWIDAIAYDSFNPASDLQQEFTPTFSSLDSVELRFDRQTGSSFPTGGAVTVAIRAGGVDGPIIGISDEVALPAKFGGPVVFRFPTPVNLTPSGLSALQPLASGGDPEWLIDASSPNLNQPDYAGGRLFFDGRFEPGRDLIFREGINIPEPTPATLLALTGVLFLAVATGTKMGKHRSGL